MAGTVRDEGDRSKAIPAIDSRHKAPKHDTSPEPYLDRTL